MHPGINYLLFNTVSMIAERNSIVVSFVQISKLIEKRIEKMYFGPKSSVCWHWDGRKG